MTDKEKEVFQGFLSKTLGITTEEFAGLYNEAGELEDKNNLLIEKDAQRVTKFKSEKNDQFKAGEKKAHERIEKELKGKYQVESDLVGIELFDHILGLQTAELKEKLSQKSNKDEDFEKSPKYIQMKKDHEVALRAKDDEHAAERTKLESEWARKETISKVAKIAFAQLEESYIMPENVQRKEAFKEVFQRELETHDYKIADDGTPVIIDKEGKPIEDAHGKMIPYKNHVDSIAVKYFDKKEANQRGNAGNSNQPQSSGNGKFKSEDEFTEAMKNAKTPEEMSELLKKRKASNLN